MSNLQSARVDIPGRSAYNDNKLMPPGNVEERLQVLLKTIQSLSESVGALGDRICTITTGEARLDQAKSPTPKPMMSTLAERLDHAAEAVEAEEQRIRNLTSRVDL